MKPASRKRKPRVKRPKILQHDDADCLVSYKAQVGFSTGKVFLHGEMLDHKEARKLAAWLLKAADYLEQKGPK